MKENVPSRTASWVATCRSLGALLPRDAQIAADPYGAAFAGAATARAIRALARVPALARPLLIAARPLLWSAVYMQVRTRLLDDCLRAFARAGGRQVVLLGAGYDCRALRLATELPGVTFFEVDHPSTQGHKRAVLARLGATGAAVAYLPWDFEKESLAALPDALGGRAHHARAERTLTIWEGVTMYLSAAAVEAAVAAVRGYSAPGSALAFTYFTLEHLAQPSRRAWFAGRMAARAGEPFRFGWSPDELPGWLSARGLDLEWDREISVAGRDLLPPALALHVPVEGRRCALARIR